MAYITLDTGFYRHPKVLALGNSALARTARDLYVGALCYSREHLTDGFVPLHALRDIDPITSGKDVERAALALYSVGLFQRKRGRFTGYWINDYDKHQQTKAEVESAKEAARLRKQRERTRRRAIETAGLSRRDTVDGHAVTHTPVTPIEAEAEAEEERTAVRARAREDQRRLPISLEKRMELERMLPYLRDQDAGSLGVLEAAAKGCSFGGVCRVRESVQHANKPVGVGYAVNALKDEAKEAA